MTTQIFPWYFGYYTLAMFCLRSNGLTRWSNLVSFTIEGQMYILGEQQWQMLILRLNHSMVFFTLLPQFIKLLFSCFRLIAFTCKVSKAIGPPILPSLSCLYGWVTKQEDCCSNDAIFKHFVERFLFDLYVFLLIKNELACALYIGWIFR